MVSNNILAGLLVVALVLSTGSLLFNLGLFGMPGIPITGQVAGTAQVEVSAMTTISLPTSTVNFGSLNNNNVTNTTSLSPYPFVLRNDGNVNVNVTIGADDLWTGTGAANPSTYYRFNSTENETGSVVSTATDLVDITNMPATASPVNVVTRLKYTNANDEVRVHIFVTVPDDEPAGSKSSTVTFTASQA
jgi:hypothetical protein